MKFRVLHIGLLGLVLTGCTGPFGTGYADSNFALNGSISIDRDAVGHYGRCLKADFLVRNRAGQVIAEPVELDIAGDSTTRFFEDRRDCIDDTNALLTTTHSISPGTLNKTLYFRRETEGALDIQASANRYGGAAVSLNLTQSYNSISQENLLSHVIADTISDTIYLSGSITTYRGVESIGLVRIDRTGALDPNFKLGSGFAHVDGSDPGVPPIDDPGSVSEVAPTSDGKVYAVGNFKYVSGTLAHYLVRLNHDGTVDASFQASGGTAGTEGFDDSLMSVFVDDDGDVLVGGEFNSFQGTPCTRIALLDAQGALKQCPAGTSIGSGRVWKLERGRNPDGTWNKTVYAFGGLASTSGYILKFTKVGNDYIEDTDFNSKPRAAGGHVYSVAATADGKLIVGGAFTSWNGEPVGRIIRIDSQGNRDTSFLSGLQGATLTVRGIAIDPATGDIFVAGDFPVFNSDALTNTARLVRITPSGQLTNYRAEIVIGGLVSYIALVKGNLYLVGGLVSTAGPHTFMGTAKFDLDRQVSE